jgi:hypothetical protein
MHLDPLLTFVAVLVACVCWAIWHVNVSYRRKLRAMTPEQRRQHDEEMSKRGQEW